jgi:hypothetical protein
MVARQRERRFNKITRGWLSSVWATSLDGNAKVKNEGVKSLGGPGRNVRMGVSVRRKCVLQKSMSGVWLREAR